MKKLTLILLISLTGCMTPVHRMQQQLRQAYTDECNYSDPALDPIRNKVAFIIVTPSDQTDEMKNNKNYPSTSEKTVISLWMTKRDECNRLEDNILLVKNKRVVDDLITLLYEGRITYGEFATFREHVLFLASDIQVLEQSLLRHSKMSCDDKK
jgi:hypothetical protein